jgi:2-phosphosulfolactate phosphatase
VKPTLEVVLTPALLPLYEVKGKTVVVIDILRATTSMCVAFQTGVKKILPVATPEECKIFKDFDFLCAAERNAVKVEGFDLGNSPFEYQNPLLKDRNIAFTTTNGTKAIKQSQEMGATQIVVGSFLNLSFLCNWLIKQNQPVLLLCAGWKDKFNLEDTLFAGAVISQIKDHFQLDCDSALMAEILFTASENKLEEVVRQSSHAKRFKSLHANEDDVKFCLQIDTLQLIPMLKEEYLVRG